MKILVPYLRAIHSTLTLILLIYYQPINTKQLSTPQKFTLLTMLYNEFSSVRIAEYRTCLEKNLKHPSIDHIHILFDTSMGITNSKLLDYLKTIPVTIEYIGKRATFADFFACINSHYLNKAIIITNADIYFDDTLTRLETFDLSNTFIALTRWNVQRNGSRTLYMSRWDNHKQQLVPLDPQGCVSQDTWIFKHPLVKFAKDDIELGLAWCDGYIAYFAHLAGLNVINPCLTITCNHLHLSNIRHWHFHAPQGKINKLQFSTLDIKKILLFKNKLRDILISPIHLPFETLDKYF